MSHPRDETDPRPPLPSALDDPFGLELDLPGLGMTPPEAAPVAPPPPRRPTPPDPRARGSATSAWLRELRGEAPAPAAPDPTVTPPPGPAPEPSVTDAPRRITRPPDPVSPPQRPLHRGRPALPVDADRPPRPAPAGADPSPAPPPGAPEVEDQPPEIDAAAEPPLAQADGRPGADREPERLTSRRRRADEPEETPRWLYLLWAVGGLVVIVVALVMLAPDATVAFLGDILRDLPGAPARIIELAGSVLHVLTGGR